MTTHHQPRWFKSTYSNTNGNCVEVASLASGTVGVRDSKDPQSPVLEFSFDEWAQLLTSIKTGVTKGSN
ncbi:DUF397 domain-containing protein [Nonomuraea sp. NPDC050643]|uniref:DUF397 domain-containing protein n=1 Tax=Nonomuraea sp. NPDC050643 TaxID=3155660 RepID=UPI0033C39E7A